MDQTSQTVLVKRRSFVTPLGCKVERVVRYDANTRLITEDIVLSHPLELVEVAVGRETILDRLYTRRRL